MRSSHLPRLLAALGVFTVVAWSPAPARADGFSIDKLPQGTLPKGPSQPGWKAPTPPESVPATEHVDGVSVRQQTYGARKKGDKPRYAYVYVTTGNGGGSGSDGPAVQQAQDDESESDGDSSNDTPSGPRVCFVDQFRTMDSLTFYHAFQVDEPRPGRAAQAQRGGLRGPVTPAPKKTGHDVRAIHLERLKVAGDQATLEATDAWLYLDTLGMRLAGSTTAKLAKVSTGPNGFALFGLREPNGGPVDFVVSAPQAPSIDPKLGNGAALENTARRLEGELPGGSSVSSSCGHVRFTMAVKPGMGDTASVVANAFLPPAADQDDDVPNGMEGMSKEFIEQMRAHTQRTRPVALDVSISQLTTEPAPLLSVTFGWAGRDQDTRF